MYINFDAIKQDVSIEQVLDLFGEKYRNDRKFNCVSKDHADNTPSMSINHKNNTCHCFSCGATFNPLSLAMEELGTDVHSAGKFLINELGLNRDVYAVEEDVLMTETDKFPFTKKELETIGLSMNYSFTTIRGKNADKMFQIEREVLNDYERFGLDTNQAYEEIKLREAMAESFMKKNIKFSMRDIYKSDREGFYGIIQNAIDNRIAVLEDAKEQTKEIFEKQRKAYYASGKPEVRNAVINAYLRLASNPDKVSEKDSKLLTHPVSKPILDAYLPLRETHRDITDYETDIEIIENIREKIPEIYRYGNGLDDIILENIEEIEIDNPELDDVER